MSVDELVAFEPRGVPPEINLAAIYPGNDAWLQIEKNVAPVFSSPVLDDFNRADQNPLAGGWTGNPSSFAVISNQLAPLTTSGQILGWAAGMPADVEVSIEFPVWGSYTILAARSDVNGTWYSLEGGQTGYALCRRNAWTITTLASYSFAAAAGDAWGLRCIGSTIQAWIRLAGVWSMLGSATDTGIDGTGANNKLSLYHDGGGASIARFDNFRGGIPGGILPDYVSAVLADSPRMYLQLSEASGTFADSSGLSHPGTAVGGVTYGVNGAVGKGITLNGTTGYLTVTDHADLDLGDVFTLECWVKITVYAAIYALISKGTGGYQLRFQAISGHPYLNLIREQSADMCTGTVQYPEDGQWHHVAATKNGATIKLYQDGVDITGTINNQTCTDTTTALGIGQEMTGGVSKLNGSIDEVAVYATALPAARVLAHYQSGSGPPWLQIQGFMGGGPGANPAWMEVER